MEPRTTIIKLPPFASWTMIASAFAIKKEEITGFWFGCHQLSTGLFSIPLTFKHSVRSSCFLLECPTYKPLENVIWRMNDYGLTISRYGDMYREIWGYCIYIYIYIYAIYGAEMLFPVRCSLRKHRHKHFQETPK